MKKIFSTGLAFMFAILVTAQNKPFPQNVNYSYGVKVIVSIKIINRLTKKVKDNNGHKQGKWPTSSIIYCRIKALEFDARIFGRKAPVHRGSSGVALGLPHLDLTAQRWLIGDTPI